jgi:predicted Zn-dependent protease
MKNVFVPIVLVGCAAAGCGGTPRLTESEEYYVGRGVAAHAIGSMPVDTHAELEEYVNLVGFTVALESDRPETFKGYHFAVLKDNESINAFAAPSGFVFVTTGALLKMESEDELAGVLAHEIAHVNLRHPELAAQRAAEKAKWFDVGRAVAGAGIFVLSVLGREDAAENLAMASTAAGEVYDEVSQVVIRGYGRDEEIAADLLAIEFLTREGVRYDPQAFKGFISRLPPGKGGPYATHPSLEGRVQVIDEEIRKRGVKVSIDPLRTQRFKAMTAVLRGQ